MTNVTAWFRWNSETKAFEFNHIEDGHVTRVRPTPKHENHNKAWARGDWHSRYGTLSDDLPPKLELQ